MPHQNEPPARVRWHRHDRLNPDLVLGELVLVPAQTLVLAEQHMVYGLLIVCHNQQRARISKFPQMSILVNFLPCESSVSAQERVALGVRCQRLPDVSYGHQETNNRGATVSGSGVCPLRVSMNMQSA